jgi:hypothetical protein
VLATILNMYLQFLKDPQFWARYFYFKTYPTFVLLTVKEECGRGGFRFLNIVFKISWWNVFYWPTLILGTLLAARFDQQGIYHQNHFPKPVISRIPRGSKRESKYILIFPDNVIKYNSSKIKKSKCKKIIPSQR